MTKDNEDEPANLSAIEKKRRRHAPFGSMKDITWIAPGVDLTEPTMPEWADLIEEKYGKGEC